MLQQPQALQQVQGRRENSRFGAVCLWDRWEDACGWEEGSWALAINHVPLGMARWAAGFLVAFLFSMPSVITVAVAPFPF